jgi:hypothetical protein
MPRWPCGISWVWWCALLGCTTAVFSAEPTSWLGQAQHCPAVPDQMRPPVRLFTQLQEPPQEAGVLNRPSTSFHLAMQSPASFTTAPPAPSISLAPFCPSTVKLMPFVPPCVSTFQIHTPPATWTVMPPRPGIRLLQVCDAPAHHGAAMQRGNVTLGSPTPASAAGSHSTMSAPLRRLSSLQRTIIQLWRL